MRRLSVTGAATLAALGGVQRLAWAGARHAFKILESGFIVHPPFFGVDHPFLVSTFAKLRIIGQVRLIIMGKVSSHGCTSHG
jgi:hypothetical protein